MKNQQRFILEEEVSVSLKELAAILNTLRQFLRQNDKTVQLFALYFQDIKEHCNRQIRLYFRFERNKECSFSIKKFKIVGEQNVLTEIINLQHCEVYSLYKNRYYIASKCGFFESNYDIWLKHSCSGILPRSKYSGTHRRCHLPKQEM